MSSRPKKVRRQKSSLLTLPRELQDQIFSYLLISPHCVGYVDRVGIQIYDQHIEHNMMSLGSNNQLAQALCEYFYQSNTFRLIDYQVPLFLGSQSHKSANLTNVVYLPNHRRTKKQPASTRPFNVAEWVKKLIVRIQVPEDLEEFHLEELRPLLECPSLRSLILDIATEHGPASLLSGKKAKVLSELKEKLGKGLRIYCDMGWSYGNPGVSSDWRQDISGMIEDH